MSGVDPSLEHPRCCPGEGNTARATTLVLYNFLSLDAMARENSSRYAIDSISFRYLSAQFHCACTRTYQSQCCTSEWTMGNDQLKSTTVRFTDSDLAVIDRLREKLGLGMIQVIRLSIRRLAELENVLPLPVARKKS